MSELQRMQIFERMGDLLADSTITALMRTASPPDTSPLSQATRLMAAWTTNGGLASWQPCDTTLDADSIAALRHYLAEGSVLPVWADADQVARAEQLFMEHGPLSCTLLFCTSLPECYVLPHLAEVLQIAGQLEARTEHRVRQTAAMVFPVMMRGGLMSAGGSGVAQVLKVRLIHATIRHLILRGDANSATGVLAPSPNTPPSASLHNALAAHGWDLDRQGMPCSQMELAYTLLTFSYCFLQGMRKLGQGLTREDEEAYLHAWNVMGHVLGIQAELMAHTMEDAQDHFERIRRHAELRKVEPDPRPALGQALIQTLARTIRVPVLRHIPVPLTHWLMGTQSAQAIGLTEHVPRMTRAVFWLGLGAVRAVDALVRPVVPGFSVSRLITRIVGYHLLTRFLMSQTRPLNLPDHLLDPLQDTVAAWGNDVHAAAWVNRLEDRFTTGGPWQGASEAGSR